MCNNNQKMITFDKKSSSESLEEYFDRISDENYERIDREFMQNIRDLDRKIDRWAEYEKIPWFFRGFLYGCILTLVGASLIYYLATHLIGKI